MKRHSRSWFSRKKLIRQMIRLQVVIVRIQLVVKVPGELIAVEKAEAIKRRRPIPDRQVQQLQKPQEVAVRHRVVILREVILVQQTADQQTIPAQRTEQLEKQVQAVMGQAKVEQPGQIL